MYTELKKQMKEAGYKVSEGNEILVEDQQAVRDFYFFTGRDPAVELYKIMFQSVAGSDVVAAQPLEDLTAVVSQPVEVSSPDQETVDESFSEPTSSSEEEFSKD